MHVRIVKLCIIIPVTVRYNFKKVTALKSLFVQVIFFLFTKTVYEILINIILPDESVELAHILLFYPEKNIEMQVKMFSKHFKLNFCNIQGNNCLFLQKFFYELSLSVNDK